MRIIVITIMVIVIIATTSVPGMILSLGYMGLGIKTHGCFERQNDFWRERMKKETIGKKRESQKTERPREVEAREGEDEEYTRREPPD